MVIGVVEIRATKSLALFLVLLTLVCGLPYMYAVPQERVDYIKIVFFNASGQIIDVRAYRIPKTLAVVFNVPSYVSSLFIYLEASTPFRPKALLTPEGMDVLSHQLDLDPSSLAVGYRYIYLKVKEYGRFILRLEPDIERKFKLRITSMDFFKEHFEKTIGAGKSFHYEFNYTLPKALKLYALMVNVTVVAYADVNIRIEALYDIISKKAVQALYGFHYLNYKIVVYGSSFTIKNEGRGSVFLSLNITPMFCCDEESIKGAVIRLFLPDHLSISPLLKSYDVINNFSAPLKVYSLSEDEFKRVVLRVKDINIQLPYLSEFSDITLEISFDSSRERVSINRINGERITLRNVPPFEKIFVKIYRAGINIATYVCSSLSVNNTVIIPFKTFSLEMEVVDKKGNPLRDGFLMIYSIDLGEVLYKSVVTGPRVKVSNLPPGEYLVILKYSGLEVFRKRLNLSENCYLYIESNLTTVSFKVLDVFNKDLERVKLLLIQGDIRREFSVERGGVSIGNILLGPCILIVQNPLNNYPLYRTVIFVNENTDQVTIAVNATDLVIVLRDWLWNAVSDAVVKIVQGDFELMCRVGKDGIAKIPAVPLGKVDLTVQKDGYILLRETFVINKPRLVLRVPFVFLLGVPCRTEWLVALGICIFVTTLALYIILRRRRKIVI
ncbi:MAG: hypothetical protein DRJ36_00495 [Thermoprotei archaeon]|nr:MAG: hypothetical protein DRJ36_00495 [Thermoprotei archaeon]